MAAPNFWPNLNTDRKVILTVVGIFLAVAILTYLPVVKGKVPFPAEMVTSFPAWDSVPGRLLVSAGQADYGDVATLFYPWRQFQGSFLRNGELPLWNPHILSGSPFLGDTESALFYPINGIFYVLPTPAAWTVKLILNIVLAGTFTALFVISIGGSLAGAVSAGIIFALAGNMTTWQSSMITDAALWLPLICLTVHRLCFIGPDRLAFALTAFAFAEPVLAGHPETAAQLTLVGTGYALWLTLTSVRHSSSAVRRLAAFALAGLLAVGLASVQIFPTLEWLNQLYHSLDLNWGTLKVHEALSFISRDIASNPNSSGLQVPESAAYAGGLTLLLVPAAFLHKNKRQAIFFLALIALSLQIVFGGPAHWLIDHAPVLKGLKNWRFLIIIDFSLAVLAGLGISALYEYRPTQRLARQYICIATTLSLGLIFTAIWMLRIGSDSAVHWLQSLQATIVFLVVAFSLIIGTALSWIRPKLFVLLSIGLLAIDLITYAYGYLPFVTPRQIYPDAPLITFLQDHDPSNARIVNLNAAYGPNAEMIYGLNAVGGWDLSLRSIKRFLEGIDEPTPHDVSITASKVIGANDRRLDLLNAKYFLTTTYNESYETIAARPDRFSLVYSEGHTQAFENRWALPRTFFVAASEHALEILPDDEAQLRRLKDPAFDPDRAVILSEMPPALADSTAAPIESSEKVRIEWKQPSPNRLEVTVRTNKRGVLVLSQIFYPGWQVSIDGVEAPILRADYALTGVVLKEGLQSVNFAYRPASFRVGAAVSAASVAILVAVLVGTGKRSRKRI